MDQWWAFVNTQFQRVGINTSTNFKINSNALHEIAKRKEQLWLRGCHILRIPYCQPQLHTVQTVVINQVQQYKDSMCCGENITSYCSFTWPSHQGVITITSVEEILLLSITPPSKERLSDILSLCNETVVMLDENTVTQCVNSVLHMLVVGSTNSASNILSVVHGHHFNEILMSFLKPVLFSVSDIMLLWNGCKYAERLVNKKM